MTNVLVHHRNRAKQDATASTQLTAPTPTAQDRREGHSRLPDGVPSSGSLNRGSRAGRLHATQAASGTVPARQMVMT